MRAPSQQAELRLWSNLAANRRAQMSSKVVAIVGSYRKGGAIDTAVEAVLEGAREKGAQTHTIYLTDQHIEFCTNCRKCTQPPGEERVKCCATGRSGADTCRN